MQLNGVQTAELEREKSAITDLLVDLKQSIQYHVEEESLIRNEILMAGLNSTEEEEDTKSLKNVQKNRENLELLEKLAEEWDLAISAAISSGGTKGKLKKKFGESAKDGEIQRLMYMPRDERALMLNKPLRNFSVTDQGPRKPFFTRNGVNELATRSPPSYPLFPPVFQAGPFNDGVVNEVVPSEYAEEDPPALEVCASYSPPMHVGSLTPSPSMSPAVSKHVFAGPDNEWNDLKLDEAEYAGRAKKNMEDSKDFREVIRKAVADAHQAGVDLLEALNHPPKKRGDRLSHYQEGVDQSAAALEPIEDIRRKLYQIGNQLHTSLEELEECIFNRKTPSNVLSDIFEEGLKELKRLEEALNDVNKVMEELDQLNRAHASALALEPEVAEEERRTATKELTNVIEESREKQNVSSMLNEVSQKEEQVDRLLQAPPEDERERDFAFKEAEEKIIVSQKQLQEAENELEDLQRKLHAAVEAIEQEHESSDTGKEKDPGFQQAKDEIEALKATQNDVARQQGKLKKLLSQLQEPKPKMSKSDEVLSSSQKRVEECSAELNKLAKQIEDEKEKAAALHQTITSSSSKRVETQREEYANATDSSNASLGKHKIQLEKSLAEVAAKVKDIEEALESFARINGRTPQLKSVEDDVNKLKEKLRFLEQDQKDVQKDMEEVHKASVEKLDRLDKKDGSSVSKNDHNMVGKEGVPRKGLRRSDDKLREIEISSNYRPQVEEALKGIRNIVADLMEDMDFTTDNEPALRNHHQSAVEKASKALKGAAIMENDLKGSEAVLEELQVSGSLESKDAKSVEHEIQSIGLVLEKVEEVEVELKQLRLAHANAVRPPIPFFSSDLCAEIEEALSAEIEEGGEMHLSLEAEFEVEKPKALALFQKRKAEGPHQEPTREEHRCLKHLEDLSVRTLKAARLLGYSVLKSERKSAGIDFSPSLQSEQEKAKMLTDAADLLHKNVVNWHVAVKELVAGHPLAFPPAALSPARDRGLALERVPEVPQPGKHGNEEAELEKRQAQVKSLKESLNNVPGTEMARLQHHQDAVDEATAALDRLAVLEGLLEDAIAKREQAQRQTAKELEVSEESPAIREAYDAGNEELSHLKDLLRDTERVVEDLTNLRAAHAEKTHSPSTKVSITEDPLILVEATERSKEKRNALGMEICSTRDKAAELLYSVYHSPSDKVSRIQHHRDAAAVATETLSQISGTMLQLEDAAKELEKALEKASEARANGASFHEDRLAEFNAATEELEALKKLTAELAETEKEVRLMHSAHIRAPQLDESQQTEDQKASTVQGLVEATKNASNDGTKIEGALLAQGGKAEALLQGTEPMVTGEVGEYHRKAACEAQELIDHLTEEQEKLEGSINKLSDAITTVDQQVVANGSSSELCTAREQAAKELLCLRGLENGCRNTAEELCRIRDMHLQVAGLTLDDIVKKGEKKGGLYLDLEDAPGADSPKDKWTQLVEEQKKKVKKLEKALTDAPEDEKECVKFHHDAVDEATAALDQLAVLEGLLEDAIAKREQAQRQTAKELEVSEESPAIREAYDAGNEELSHLKDLLRDTERVVEDLTGVRASHVKAFLPSSVSSPHDRQDALLALNEFLAESRARRRSLDKGVITETDIIENLREDLEPHKADVSTRRQHYSKGVEEATQVLDQLNNFKKELGGLGDRLDEMLNNLLKEITAEAVHQDSAVKDAKAEKRRVVASLNACHTAIQNTKVVLDEKKKGLKEVSDFSNAVRLARIVQDAEKERKNITFEKGSTLVGLMDDLKQCIADLEEGITAAGSENNDSESMQVARKNADDELRKLHQQLAKVEELYRNEINDEKAIVSSSRRFVASHNGSCLSTPSPELPPPTLDDVFHNASRQLPLGVKPPFYNRMLKDEKLRSAGDNATVGGGVVPLPAKYGANKVKPSPSPYHSLSPISAPSPVASTNYNDLVLADYVSPVVRNRPAPIKPSHLPPTMEDSPRFEIRSSPEGDIVERDALEGRRYWNQKNSTVIPHRLPSAVIDDQELRESQKYRLHSIDYRDLVTRAAEEAGGERGEVILNSFLKSRYSPKKPIQQRRFYELQSIDWSKVLSNQETDLKPYLGK